MGLSLRQISQPQRCLCWFKTSASFNYFPGHCISAEVSIGRTMPHPPGKHWNFVEAVILKVTWPGQSLQYHLTCGWWLRFFKPPRGFQIFAKRHPSTSPRCHRRSSHSPSSWSTYLRTLGWNSPMGHNRANTWHLHLLRLTKWWFSWEHVISSSYFRDLKELEISRKFLFHHCFLLGILPAPVLKSTFGLTWRSQ